MGKPMPAWTMLRLPPPVVKKRETATKTSGKGPD